jgi:Arc/MetJ family transcription regulator
MDQDAFDMVLRRTLDAPMARSLDEAALAAEVTQRRELVRWFHRIGD